MIELINGVENFSCVPDITFFPDLKDSKRDFQIVANSPGRSLTRSLWIYIYIYIFFFFFKKSGCTIRLGTCLSNAEWNRMDCANC